MGCANWERIVTANGGTTTFEEEEREERREERHCLFLIDTHYCCGGVSGVDVVGNDVAERQIDAGATQRRQAPSEKRIESAVGRIGG